MNMDFLFWGEGRGEVGCVQRAWSQAGDGRIHDAHADDGDTLAG